MPPNSQDTANDDLPAAPEQDAPRSRFGPVGFVLRLCTLHGDPPAILAGSEPSEPGQCRPADDSPPDTTPPGPPARAALPFPSSASPSTTRPGFHPPPCP